MIPTTAGTGSEATPNAIVAVPEQELKVGIVSDAMIADNVLLDPLMIKICPRKLRRPQVWTLWRTPSNVTQAIRQIPSAILLRWKRWI